MASRIGRGRHNVRFLLVTIALVILVVTLLTWKSNAAREESIGSSKPAGEAKEFTGPNTPPEASFVSKTKNDDYTAALVVSSTKEEDVSWISKELDQVPNLSTYIYKADGEEGMLRPPRNKGHESTIYLTYIIDFYDTLPDVTIFIHAHQYTWHNNKIHDNDMGMTLRMLRREHVVQQGFFNLRCHLESGCPNHINLASPRDDPNKAEEVHFPRVWAELHGFKDGAGSDYVPPMPDTMSAPCCSQFAASRNAIQRIPRERWIHYRDWLLQTSLPDNISGRIWEFTWHYILLDGVGTHCPPMNECYCQGYGICFGNLARVENYLQLKEIHWIMEQEILFRRQRALEGDERIEDVRSHIQFGAGMPLEQRLEDAIERGKDPALRALESGNVSHSGVHESSGVGQ